MSDDNYIVEYIVIGKSVKATAIDPITMKEVSVIGDVSMPRKQLGKLAARKLIYMIKRDGE
jgi:hypothetical protein